MSWPKRLERDYKNVHTDVARLVELGLIERRADGGVAVPWDGDAGPSWASRSQPALL